ncbi:MAG: HEAT repeat domain-containing protein [Myxococcales bacterium]
MGTLAFIGLVGGLIAFVKYFSRRQEQHTDRVWARAARELGGTFNPAKRGELRRLEGLAEGCRFEVAEILRGKGQCARFLVTARGIPTDVVLHAKGQTLSRVLRGDDHGAVLGQEQVTLGDEVFDQHVKASGPEDSVRAALGPKARAFVGLLFAADRSMALVDGKLMVEELRILDEVEHIVPLVRAMLDAATLLRVTGVPETLARNLKDETDPPVQLRLLETLAGHYPGHPAAREAARHALGGTNPSVLLAAAKVLGGDEERAMVSRLLESQSSSPVPSEARIAALQRMVEISDGDEVRRHVARMLESAEPEELCAAMKAAAERRDATVLPRIGELCGSADASVARAAAIALAQMGDPRGQPPLVQLLGHGDAEARHAAVVALGKLGDVRAVEPLLPLANAVLPGALRDAAREAVRRIQGRLGDAAEGRLSMSQVDDEAVAGLSVAPHEPEKSKA